MYGRTGLDRFKKAQSSEPFSVTTNSAANAHTQLAFRESGHPGTVTQVSSPQNLHVNQHNVLPKAVVSEVLPVTVPTQSVTQIGGAQSSWQPPDWAIDPRAGVYYLDVMKDGEVLDTINLDKRRHIFGRQFQTCDFVLDHQSVSRQHAAVIPHKNGSIYVIDLGSAHGTFVANERLTKDSPVELEVGQSLRFAASTRTYILRKNDEALFPQPLQLADIDLPPPPDPLDEDAVLAYNTYINKSLNGSRRPDTVSKSGGAMNSSAAKDYSRLTERAPKRMRRIRVAFKDQIGDKLVEVVGFSDGVDVETEPGPVGVKEGSLVGKYESLVQVTVIPKGKEQNSVTEATSSRKGVTEKLQQVLDKVKTPAKSGGIYGDLYGDSLSVKVGSSWAFTSVGSGGGEAAPSKYEENARKSELEKSESKSGNNVDDDDDLFG